MEKYNVQNGWYVNWSELLVEFEVYALVLKGTVDIQGLIALKYIAESASTYVGWMCVDPQSNPEISDRKKFSGIGGHLFAIAVDKSFEYGTNGEFYGFAANEELLCHYRDAFGVTHIGVLHPYHFVLSSKVASKIKGEYSYEWTDEEV